MAGTKKQTEQQRMEWESFRLVEDLLPREWVHHQYSPDYGIDRVLEVFELMPDDDKRIAQTLGELLFVQIKSTNEAQIQKRIVYARGNVAKSPIAGQSKRGDDSQEIGVVTYPLEVSLLNTVSAMGPAIPVMLFYASLADRRLYFLCLNDLIDKVLIPEQPEYRQHESVTIAIPAINVLGKNQENDAYSLHALKAYAKRSKYYAAFNIFVYQNHELHYSNFDPAMVKHFYDQISHYDFWSHPNTIPVYREIGKELAELGPVLQSASWREDNYMVGYIEHLWNRLASLGRLYEECHREAFMATLLGALL